MLLNIGVVHAVDFTTILLCQLHEYDGALGNDCIDHESGQDNDQYGAQTQAEVAFAPLNILNRVLDEEAERLPEAKATDFVAL